MQIDGVNIEWLGWATFKINAGLTIYIDPYVLPEDAEKADLILITHEHYDHCDAAKVKQVSTEKTVVIAPPDCASKLSGNVRTIAPGDTTQFGGISIKAVPAYNIGKQFHPKQNNWVGYIITVKGKKIYHAGDTDFIPEMADLKAEDIDVALLPCGGTYVMDLGEAVQAATTIKPKIAVPMHYGKDTIKGISLPADSNKFKKEVEAAGIKVELLI